MTCPTNFDFIQGLCYSPCIAGWEKNSEDATTCVEVGCGSYTVPSSANPAVQATCSFNTYAYTNEYCEKRLTNDAACGCHQLYSDNGNGACQKFSKTRASVWPSCSLFEQYDGRECTFNTSYFIFVFLLFFGLVILFYMMMKKNPVQVVQAVQASKPTTGIID
jgi:hypothetical protein